VSPGEEPRFFDELGCLRDYLSLPSVTLPSGTMIYVADHRTGAWIDASRATFTRTATATPMASGLMAHAEAASRDADPAAHGGVAVTADEILRPIRAVAP
jgi:copper chaperone NosL